MDIAEAVKRLRFADYLISKDNSASYTNAAVRHILQAANIATAEHLQLDGRSKVSPMLARQKLAEGSEVEKELAESYLELMRMTQRAVTREEAVKVYKQVKAFVDWVREKKLDRDDRQSKPRT